MAVKELTVLSPGRNCGSCDACCNIAEIGEIDKPAFTPCPLLRDPRSEEGNCTVYGKHPKACQAFKCSWLEGIGKDGDRPKEIGAMFFVRETEDGVFGFAMETEDGALLTTARSMAISMARSLEYPIICVANGKRPPDDTGDWVILRGDLMHRASHIAGKLRDHLAPDVAMYELTKGVDA